MSNIDIRNLNLPQIGVQTEDTTVATSTPSTIVGTPQPTIQNPFSVGYVAASTSIDLPNGTSLNLPSLSQDDLQQVNTLFGGMNPQQLDNVNQASQRLAKALFAAVAQNSSSSASSIGAATGGSGSAGATSGQASAVSATDTASQRVDSLTSSFYQTMTQTQMNVQPEDGDNSDDDNDDDDDTNSWGVTGSVPKMQNVQDVSTTPTLQLASVATSTTSVAATGQLASVSTNSVTTSNANAIASLLTVTQGAAASTGSAGATSSATVVAGVGQARIADTNTTSAAALAQLTQSTTSASPNISTTQNKLLSSSSPIQAPVVSTGTPEVYSAAANAVSVYQQGAAAAASVTGSTTAVSSGSLDYDGSVNAVTYMGIIGLQQQLGAYAQQTQTQLNQLNAARTEYEDVGTAVANWPAGQQTQHFDWTTFDSNGKSTAHSADLTYDQAATLKSNLEDQVNGMSDTNQEQQLQLQSLTQDYAQAINTMSNLLKMDFDTVKSVINNIRA